MGCFLYDTLDSLDNDEKLAEANFYMSASTGEKNIPRFHFIQNFFAGQVGGLGGSGPLAVCLTPLLWSKQ